MQAVPDTGAGLSGFLGHSLWQAYRHFPSPGGSDWLLLFILISVGVHGLFLPHLWKSVGRDIEHLQEGTPWHATRGFLATCFATGSRFFFLWFFGTPAGRTFIEGRRLLWIAPITEGSRLLYWGLLMVTISLPWFVLEALEKKVDRTNEGTRAPRSQAHERRNFLTLYAGGGVFTYQADGDTGICGCEGVLTKETLFVSVPLVFYWYWSAASLTLMWCFVCAAVLFEAARLGFVHIQHKRTFG